MMKSKNGGDRVDGLEGLRSSQALKYAGDKNDLCNSFFILHRCQRINHASVQILLVMLTDLLVVADSRRMKKLYLIPYHIILNNILSFSK